VLEEHHFEGLVQFATDCVLLRLGRGNNLKEAPPGEQCLLSSSAWRDTVTGVARENASSPGEQRQVWFKAFSCKRAACKCCVRSSRVAGRNGAAPAGLSACAAAATSAQTRRRHKNSSTAHLQMHTVIFVNPRPRVMTIVTISRPHFRALPRFLSFLAILDGGFSFMQRVYHGALEYLGGRQAIETFVTLISCSIRPDICAEIRF